MSTPRPDQTTLENLIALGQCTDGDARLAEALGLVKANLYLQSFRGIESFEWLREVVWADACAFVRGLTRAEIERLTNIGGSVSPVKNAYRALAAC